jgi:hypothetical protein
VAGDLRMGPRSVPATRFRLLDEIGGMTDAGGNQNFSSGSFTSRQSSCIPCWKHEN